MSIAWFIARPKLTFAILFTLALVGWHYQDKISDWWDDRKIQKLEARVADLEEYQRNAEATQQAGREARGRNDEVIPKARRATADRIARADSADAAQRLRDDQEAQAEYAAAASLVRGKGSR